MSSHLPQLGRWIASLVLTIAAVGCAARSPQSLGGKEPGALRAAGPLADAAPWLAPVAKLARDAGARELVPLGLVAGQEGERTGGFVERVGGQCVLAVARGASTVVDADVHIFSDGGDLLAADEARSAEAGVLICPPLPERLYVSGRIVSGRGVMALGAAQVPPEVAAAVARAVGARLGAQSGHPDKDPWSALERAQRERREEVGPGWPELRRVLLPVEARARSHVSVPVGANRCIDVLAVPGEAVQGVEMAIAARDGRVVAQAPPGGRARAQAVCAHAEQVADVQMRAVGTAGLAVVLVRESPEGAWTELDAPLWLDEPRAAVTVAEASEQLVTTLRSSWGPPLRVAVASAAVGHARRFPIELAKGCTRIDVVAGVPLAGLLGELWSEGGRLLAKSEGGAQGTLFHCGDASSAVVEVSAGVRAGPFEIQRRHVSSVPDAVRRHGLGAARLLGRLAARGRSLAPNQLARAVTVNLTAERRTVVPVSVPAGGCVRAVAAHVDGAGGLLRLRLVGEVRGDGEVTGEQPVHEHQGTLTVDGTICGGGTPTQGRIELASGRGAGSALLLVVEESRRP